MKKDNFAWDSIVIVYRKYLNMNLRATPQKIDEELSNFVFFLIRNTDNRAFIFNPNYNDATRCIRKSRNSICKMLHSNAATFSIKVLALSLKLHFIKCKRGIDF